MTLYKKLEQLQNEFVAKLSAITDRPADWLPHLVFVEEEGEDCNGGGFPIYNPYRLVDFTSDGTCTLRNEVTNEEEERHLSEINIEWLQTVWDRYHELTLKPEPEEPEKELCAFLFPLDRFDRNATDEEIIADWESEEDFDVPTEKLTPDEFAAQCNDETFADQIFYVRFINY